MTQRDQHDQHDQSIGGPGTEGATSGAGGDKDVDKGAPQKDESRQRQGSRVQQPAGPKEGKPHSR